MHRLSILMAIAVAVLASDLWSDCLRFRGPNGSGVAPSTRLAVQSGPKANVVWKTVLPPGVSSPVIAGDRIFLTGVDGGKLVTIALDRTSGQILWTREAPRPRVETFSPPNSGASPSPVTDGKNVYVFFGDF